tara:strand:+ start:193 stop:762 length:570 start_codon:yes stop_codon:yes gene_type:complete
MGYTHYWTFPSKYEVDAKIWKRIVDDFNKIIDVKAWNEFPSRSLRDILEPTSGQRLAITDDMIYFNGREENDQGHETFHLERKSGTDSYRTRSNEDCFTCCKTARKPYDIVACCLLIIAKKHIGKLIKISSDGAEEEWNDAFKLCQEYLGYEEASSFVKGYTREDGIYESDQLTITQGDVSFGNNRLQI